MKLPNVLVPLGCCHKIPSTGCLANSRNLVLKFWRLEVRDQGALWLGVRWGPAARSQTAHCASHGGRD